MFGFFKRKKHQHDEAVAPDPLEQQESSRQQDVEEGERRPSEADVQLEPEAPADTSAHNEPRISPLAPEAPAASESETDNAQAEADQATPGHPVHTPAPSMDTSSAAEQASPADAGERTAVPQQEQASNSREPTASEEPASAVSDLQAPQATGDAPGEGTPTATNVAAAHAAAPDPASEATVDDKSARGGFFSRIRKGLSKTRSNLTGGLATLFLGDKEIDDELIEDLETQLLMADIGVVATTDIIDRLTERVSRKELSNASSLYKALQEELAGILTPVEQPLVLPPKGEGPFVILVVGVNGVGKTTTIGKLARRFKSEGRSVMLAAGDTFRAAAVEQLKVWGERNDVAVVAQHTGADSASVIYDALSAARARNVDVLIADTAGRLHNKAPLMEELKKVQRVMAKLDQSAPHEVMLVVDAGTGQNAISQAETFGEAVPITGITLTKLDGTAKGGVIFALARQTGIPIRFIGVGESLEDLRPFQARPFTDALFDQRSS